MQGTTVELEGPGLGRESHRKHFGCGNDDTLVLEDEQALVYVTKEVL